MRIAAGRHKGLRLAVPRGGAVRPTGERARQALFNILDHAYGALRGARVLDAFAGSGALGLEALSRGAASLVAFDSDRAAAACARRNLAAAGESDHALILAADVLAPPPAGRFPGFAPCALAFLDPPYGRGLIAPALLALAGRGWLAPGALVVAERERREAFAAPPGFAPLEERLYGKARLIFLRARGAEGGRAEGTAPGRGG